MSVVEVLLGGARKLLWIPSTPPTGFLSPSRTLCCLSQLCQPLAVLLFLMAEANYAVQGTELTSGLCQSFCQPPASHEMSYRQSSSVSYHGNLQLYQPRYLELWMGTKTLLTELLLTLLLCISFKVLNKRLQRFDFRTMHSAGSD